MDTHKKIREHISALSDGALCNNDLELAMAAMQTADGREAWNLYHRIGDVMRAQATPELSDSFSDRLAARLDQEAVPVRRGSKALTAEAKAETRAAGSTHLQIAPGGSEQRAVPALACEAGQEGVAVSTVKPPVFNIS